jgi:hypothetical protein
MLLLVTLWRAYVLARLSLDTHAVFLPLMSFFSEPILEISSCCVAESHVCTILPRLFLDQQFECCQF